MPAWTNIPVFISSTFMDMQAERDLLVKRVFPALRSRLQSLRVRISEIDLRWGITAEQEQNGRVLDLCLNAIDRSRPHFLGFLGERYGSIPATVPPDTRRVFDWLPQLHPPRTSVTEMEILHGLLNHNSDSVRGLFYFRAIEGYAELPDTLAPFFFDAESGRPDWRLTDDQWFATTVDRLVHSGSTEAAGHLERWLRGVWPPEIIELALTPSDRLRLLKMRLKQSGHVQLASYPWKLQGIRVRLPLAHLAIPNDRRIQTLEAAAVDGIVSSDELLQLSRNPDLLQFLRQYGTVVLTGLDELEKKLHDDLWQSLHRDERIEKAELARKAEAPIATGSILNDDERLLLAVRRFAGEALPIELKLLKGKQASGLLRMELEGNLELASQLQSYADLWDARRNAGGADVGSLAELWDDERDSHRRYAEGRQSLYVRRPEIERHMRTHLLGESCQYLVVVGGPGDGKSALMAKTIKTCQALGRVRPAHIVFHFIGATAGSARLAYLLQRLSVELRLFDEDTLERLSLDIQDIAPRFAQALQSLPADRKYFIIIDGLDQLDSTGDAHNLHWLPQTLPAHVHVVLSYVTDADHGFAPALDAALRLRSTEWIDLRKYPMAESQLRQIIERVPSLVAKSLEEPHIAALLANPATRNPLYLKVALEELRGFGSYSLLSARIQQFREATSAADLFRQVIRGLRDDFPPVIVRELLTAIACSRHGMSEDELAQLSLRNCRNREDRVPQEIQAMRDETALLLRSLQPYLQFRGLLQDFLHRSIRAAVVEEWLGDDELCRTTHKALARHFEAVGREAQPPWSDAGRRALAETLHHYLEAEDWIAVRELLNDDRYVFSKGYSPYCRDLVHEWSRALTDAPLDQATAMANSLARLASQQNAMSEIAGETIVALARRSQSRLVELAPSLRRISDRWRYELLRAQAVLIGIGLGEAAETTLQLIANTHRPGEQDFGNESTRLQNEAVQANMAGNHKLGLQLAERSRQAAIAGNEPICVIIAEATMVGSLVGLARYPDAAHLTRDILGRSRSQAGLSRVLPRVILNGFNAFVQLGLIEEAETLMAEGFAECNKIGDARYDYTALATVWGNYCIETGKATEALATLRTALGYPSNAYPEEIRTTAFYTLIQALLRVDKPDEAREVFQAAHDFLWSSPAARQKMHELLNRFVAPPEPDHQADLGQLINQALGFQHAGNLEEASATFAKLLEAAPENVVVLGIVAFFLQNSLRDFPSARALYERSIEIDPADVVNQTNLASLEFLLGEQAAAQARIDICLTLAAGKDDEYTARIDYLAVVLAAIRGDATDELLSQLRTRVISGREPAAWRNSALIEAVQQKVPPPIVDLLQAIFEAFSSPSKWQALKARGEWKA